MTDDDAPNEGGTNTNQQHDDSTGDQRTQRQEPSRDTKPAQEPEQQDSGKTFTQADVDRLLTDRLSRERKKFDGHDDLKKKAAKFDELEAAKKSEVEKLNDQLTASQVELQGYKVAEIRRSAAVEAGLDVKYAKYITAADDAGALEQAKELAKDIRPAEPRAADLKQGARPNTPQQASRDDLLRGLAGYGR